MSPFDPAWSNDSGPPAGEFSDAVLAAALLAIDPAHLGGIVVRAWSGPAREAFLANLTALFPAGTTARKLPLSITDDRLLGGLDLAATLQAGRPIRQAGLLAEAEDQILHLAMAERLTAATAGKIVAALDAGARIALVALDEGATPDEAPPKSLAERLAFTVTQLPAAAAPWPARARIAAASRLLPAIEAEAAVEQLCGLSLAFGVASLRACLLTLRAARAAAALAGRRAIEPADIELAARLVLLPRATQIPAAPADDEPSPPPEPPPESLESQERDRDAEQPLEDTVTEAEKAALPPELLAALASAAAPRRLTRGAGTSGKTTSPTRGRPAGARPGPLTQGARLSLIETLRAAAPWQPLRRTETRKIVIRKDDFRIRKFKESPRSVAIFAVDASGSSALNRLGEAKGAIQLLLAGCYVRREQVALIAFRNKSAALLLAPTHALARARRGLAALPGGGPTPLAAGIDAARALAEAERRAGKQPLLVILTDGGANIGRTGQPGRAAAAADALAAAAACRGQKFPALVVDTAPRPQKFVDQLATAMGAKYLALPYADPARLSRAVQAQGARHAGLH